jgi:gamma-glutamylcyclotransferase
MTPADKLLLFAYGSNMLSVRIQERCPSARALGVAKLLGHELAWHKRSADGSGKCDVVPGTATSAVFGVVYTLPRSEKAGLDCAEGLGAGYEERTVCVWLQDTEMVVVLYGATHTDTALKPYTWYRELVVAGAREHGLPHEYLHRIQTVAVIEDPDRERHARNMALVWEVPNP